MKRSIKYLLILTMTVLFFYQSTRTIEMYRANKTSLQVSSKFNSMVMYLLYIEVTMIDSGSILFPSITVCKDEMYDSRLEGGLFTRLNSGALLIEDAAAWFNNRTVSRSELVKLLSIKTVDPTNNYPCNAVSGKREGETCSFPFLFPDCQQRKKTGVVCQDPVLQGVSKKRGIWVSVFF